jgi:hypothetical protein
VQEGHHGFGLEGVELVEAVEVQLGLAYEQHQRDLELLLLEVSAAGEGEGLERLRVEDDVVACVQGGVLIENSFSCDSVENSESVML